MDTIERSAANDAAPFRVWRLVLSVLAVLLFISAASRWYAGNITMPRYCEYDEDSVLLLERVLTETRPAGEADRKPYIIAARLMFLVPREGGEALDDYLRRVRGRVAEMCQ